MRARNSFEPFTYYIECRKALASFTTSLALFKYFSEGNCLSLLLSRVDIFVAFRRFVRRSSNAVQNDDDVGSARQKRTENIFCSFCCCDERKRRKEKKKKTNFFGFKFESLLCSACSLRLRLCPHRVRADAVYDVYVDDVEKSRYRRIKVFASTLPSL